MAGEDLGLGMTREELRRLLGEWIALTPMLAGIMLCAALQLYFINSGESIEVQRVLIEHHQLRPEATPPVAAETSQSPLPVPSADQRSLAELHAGLQAIAAEESKLTTTGTERDRQTALLRLRMYRFLCFVPQDDLTLDPQLNEDALAVADICRRLGKLSHAPDNPGMPEPEYQRARVAAGKCNLAFGRDNLTKAIDLWMADSDAGNLGQLGHRRWCLNPQMLKLGLGRSGDFCAMWAFDNSRRTAPDYDFISFPPPGFVPIDFFGATYAWSITLNPAKYLAPVQSAVTIELIPIQQNQSDRQHPIEIEHLTVDTQGFGVNNCVLFRPKSLEVRPHLSYQLVIGGLQTLDGKPTNVTFTVGFVDAFSIP